MIKNNKGFSLVELLAMILITTILIYPLMQALVKNIEVNERLHLRQSATSIASTSLYGFEKLDYDKLYGLLDDKNTNGEYILELNALECDSLTSGSADELLCIEIFNLISNNFTAGAEEYKVFIYNYNLPVGYYNELTRENNTSIPEEVKDQIRILDTSESDEPSPETLLRVTVWIKYYNDPPYYVVLSGLIFDEKNLG